VIERMSQVTVLLKQTSQKRPLRSMTPREQILSALPSALLQSLPLRYAALSALVSDRLDGHWSVDDTDAAYFAFNSWGRPQEARHLARFLLADLASFLTERVDEPPPVLLLIKHPERLLSTERLPQLFAQMEQAHGTLFLASRSVTDFGEAARGVFNNASTLLVHRSQSEIPFEPYVLLPATHPFFTGAVQNQFDQECFVIEQGLATQVRIAPVQLDAHALALARESISPPFESFFPDGWDELEDDDHFFTELFGKGAAIEPGEIDETATPIPVQTRQKKHARSKAAHNESAMEQQETKQNGQNTSPSPRKRSHRRRPSSKKKQESQQIQSPLASPDDIDWENVAE
jgi:hypothetical protein